MLRSLMLTTEHLMLRESVLGKQMEFPKQKSKSSHCSELRLSTQYPGLHGHTFDLSSGPVRAWVLMDPTDSISLGSCWHCFWVWTTEGIFSSPSHKKVHCVQPLWWDDCAMHQRCSNSSQLSEFHFQWRHSKNSRSPPYQE